MKEAKISIEGQDAAKAAENLFSIGKIQGSWTLVSEDSPYKER